MGQRQQALAAAIPERQGSGKPVVVIGGGRDQHDA